MSLKDNVEPFEAYSRSYVYYLLSFVGGRREADEPAPSLDDGKLVVHVIISAFLASLLQGMAMKEFDFQSIDFPGLVIVRFCYWIVLCAVLHGVLATRRNKVSIETSASVVMQVMPAASVFAAFLSFVVYSATYSMLAEYLSPGVVLVTFFMSTAVLEVLFIGFFLIAQLRRVEGVSRARRLFSLTAMLLFIATLQAVIVAGRWPAGDDTDQAVAASAAAGNISSGRSPS